MRGDGPVGGCAFGTARVAAAFGGRGTQPGDRRMRLAGCGGADLRLDPACQFLGGGPRLFELTDNRDHFALDAHFGGGQEHFRIAGVGRLQSDLVAFEKEVFEGGLVLGVDPGGDHFTVFGTLLVAKDDDVAVEDAGVDHGVALDAEGVELIRVAVEGLVELEPFVGSVVVGGLDLDRLAGSDVAEDGYLEEVEGGAVGGLVGRGRAGEVFSKACFLEAGPVEAEAAADFFLASDQLVSLQFGEVVFDD